MAISKGKARLDISLKKESLDLITKFADAMGMTKSQFIEDVCISFIADVVKHQQELRKNSKKEA